MSQSRLRRSVLGVAICLPLLSAEVPAAERSPAPSDLLSEARALLDAPLLFVKRHSYTGIHIYDTFYKWPPGGGGIYVVENPSEPREAWRIRPVIDPSTPGTLGLGVYSHPEPSWDAKRLLFCFKGEPDGSTSIHEIGVDGRGLRRLTDPSPSCGAYKGTFGGGVHDIAPAWLPDGRIVFLSTRPSGLVPCMNSGVAILHVMEADGSDIHPISVNNVNEFDPSVLPDGRILFGRWEYVDKNALTIQSLWTVHPDGTEETAFFANNMVFPEAVLDARPVPGSHLVVGTLAKHNATPRGSIAFIDPSLGKNDPRAIANLEHPENPTFDTGDSCEPWPLSPEVVLFSGRPPGHGRNVLEVMDRSGRRAVLLSDPEICLHSPMLVKPRPRPPTIVEVTDRKARTGRFFVPDIYNGLAGVRRGEVKNIRVIEETSRVSPSTMGGSPYNQTFLVSAALAFSVKNFLGVVPVEEDGSAYFEVPSGRAVYLQALDAEGRIVQSMRTFVQAAPGTTRSCIGCHEYKYGAPPKLATRGVLGREPSRLRPESWGSGHLDYPSMVQPVLDRRCVSCHGGDEGIAAGLDLSGGWTEHFSISYENLVNRRETQLVAHWIAGIDCMNGTALWSSKLFVPRGHGSGAAPLADILVRGHEGRIPDLTRTERDLLLAWIDTNGLYHGTWDYTAQGCATRDWSATREALIVEMRSAGCVRCHGDPPAYFENDWINLRDPERSRILRAPLGPEGDGWGLELCRDRPVDPRRQRIHLLWNGYAHAVQPPEAFVKHPVVPPDPSGAAAATFASARDERYQRMLAIIRDGREKALASPRVDMPGAEVQPGACRQFLPPPLPDVAPPLEASLGAEGIVELRWERSARTIGLETEVHRGGDAGFAPDDRTLLARSTLGRYVDKSAPPGLQHYALVLTSVDGRSRPAHVSVSVPTPLPPPAPTGLEVVPASATVRLRWRSPPARVLGYHVYRRTLGAEPTEGTPPGGLPAERLTPEPVRSGSFTDARAQSDVRYAYCVRAVGLRGAESEATAPVEASARIIREPMFSVAPGGEPRGILYGGEILPAVAHGSAKVSGGIVDLGAGGHLTFPHRGVFDLAQPLSLECWVRLDKPGQASVLASCGVWTQVGWFLQQLGDRWRWHVGGIDCDGGAVAAGRWVHLVGTFDGEVARLFQDGAFVAERPGTFNVSPWPGELHVGQYSAQAGPSYQVRGRLSGLKIYHRALAAEEVAAAARVRPE